MLAPESSDSEVQEPPKVNTKALNLMPLVVALVALVSMALVAICAKYMGLVFNVTNSMPDRFYFLGHGAKHSMHSFCSPIPHPSLARGPCTDGSLPLIKRVVGVAGDLITVTDAGIEINGRPVPNSKPLDADTRGSALPRLRGSWNLKPGEVWVAGEHPNSFDSRYFGPVLLTNDSGRADLSSTARKTKVP